MTDLEKLLFTLDILQDEWNDNAYNLAQLFFERVAKSKCETTNYINIAVNEGKISAIRAIRADKNWDLKFAKEYIEDLVEKSGKKFKVSESNIKWNNCE